MATHRTFFGKLFGSAWDAVKDTLKNIFEAANHDLLQAAVLVTNAAKAALNSGAVDTIINFTSTTIDNDVVKIAREKLTLLLATELALKDLNAEPTEDAAKKLADDILQAFGGLDDAGKEKFYTSLAADFYILSMQVKEGKKVTFGQAAALVEGLFETWQQSVKK